MMWQRSRIALLACGVLASAVASVRAGDCGTPCATPASDCGTPCAPAVTYKTVCVTEWTAENYQATRTVLKTEYVQEKYTAYKTECVQEQRTRTYTINKCVPETQTKTRTVMVATNVVEPRTITKCIVKCIPVTTKATRVVDRGHFECSEVVVPCAPASHSVASSGSGHRLLGRFHKKSCGGCGDDCCAPVDCGPTYVTKTVKTWVPNCVTEEYDVTRLERKVETVVETINVTVCKLIPKEETYTVTINKIVPETKTETYMVSVPKTVAYEATRTIAKCVPVTETYTACRMVPHTVEKLVPVTDCCAATACCGHSARSHKLLGRLGGKSCCH